MSVFEVAEHTSLHIFQCLCQMWPFISDMVSTILKESVEPEVKKNMPSLPVLGDVLKSFHFVEVDLGSHVSCLWF